MDERTRTALEKSIEHWRQNAAAERPDQVTTGGSNCAICRLSPASCKPCPVMGRTGRPSCKGTPYEDAHRAWCAWHADPSDEQRDYFRVHASRMVEFLESLRPAPVAGVSVWSLLAGGHPRQWSQHQALRFFPPTLVADWEDVRLSHMTDHNRAIFVFRYRESDEGRFCNGEFVVYVDGLTQRMVAEVLE